MTTPLQLTEGTSRAVAIGVEFERAPRCRVSLRHYRRATAPFAPSSAAVVGALEIYLEGRHRDDVLRMLFGLSILRSATAAQVDAALTAGDDAISTEVRSLITARAAPAIILL